MEAAQTIDFRSRMCQFARKIEQKQNQEKNNKHCYKQPTKFITDKTLAKLIKLPSRTIQVHMFPIQQNSWLYEDNSILINKKWDNYKIHGFTVGVNYNKWINFLRFEYINLETGETVLGRRMGAGTIVSDYQEFKLDIDQFAIGLETREGYILDKITILTSKHRKLEFGGKGGEVYLYILPKGFHIGPISSCLGEYLNGFQFDMLPIPKHNDSLPIKKQEHKQNTKLLKSKFLFFENQKLFSYAVEFLSCRQIMKLFLVNKRVSQYRKNCQIYWAKCLNLCDKFMLNYLQNMVCNYKLHQLTDLLSLNKWREISLKKVEQEHPHVTFYSLNSSTLSSNLTIGNSYLIIVAVVYQTSWMDKYPLRLFDNDIKILQVNKNLCGWESKSLQIKKISILFRYNLQTYNKLTNFRFIPKNNFLEIYSICSACSLSAGNKNFEVYKEGILVNASNDILRY